MENNTLNCPHCGKEISTEFMFCPFCKNNIYHNPTKVTAAEFIESRKVIEQNESQDLRKKILEFYNIKGDVSDEEYAQLKNFYQKDNPAATKISHTSNNGETLLSTMAIVLLVLCIIGGIWLTIRGDLVTGFAVIGSSLLTFAFTSVFLNISKNIRAIADLLERKM